MSQNRLYEIAHLPDAVDERLSQHGTGAIPDRITDISRHLMNVLVSFAPGTASLTLRFVVDPGQQHEDARRRLRIFIEAQASDPANGDLLRHWLEGPQVQALFPLQKIEGPGPVTPGQARYHLARRVGPRPSSLRPDETHTAPEVYFEASTLEAGDIQSFQWLDSIFAGLAERVTVEISLFPVPIEETVQAAERYSDHLRELERRGLSSLRPRDRGRGTTHDIDPVHQADPAAPPVRRGIDKLLEQLHQPSLGFEISARAESRATARLVLQAIGNSAFAGGWTSVDSSDWPLKGDTAPERCLELQSAIYEAIIPEQWQAFYRRLAPVVTIGSVEELCSAFRLPYAERSSLLTVERSLDPPSVSDDSAIQIGHEIQGGTSQMEEMITLIEKLPTKSLVRHLFVSGNPGSGKSLFIALIIVELNRRGIPVPTVGFELAKAEASSLKYLIHHHDSQVQAFGQQFQIITAGDETLNPLRMNLLARPFEEVSIAQHIEDLIELTGAMFSMSEILRSLIREGLHKLLTQWTLDRPPSMEDLETVVHQVIRSRNYSQSQTDDFCGAVSSRLGGLQWGLPGSIFQCREASNPRIEDLLSGHTVLQFEAIKNERVIAAVVFRLFQIIHRYAQVHFRTPRPDVLPHLILWSDELHVLTGDATASSDPEVDAAPQELATQALARMLAELRSLGVAVILSDQHPSTVHESLIKSVGTLWCGTQLYPADQRYVAEAMGLTAAQQQQLLTLMDGKAFFRTVGYQQPVLIQTRNAEQEFGIGHTPEPQEVWSMIQNDARFVESTENRMQDELLQLAERVHTFTTWRRRLVSYVEQLDRILHKLERAPRSYRRVKRARRIRRLAQRTLTRLSKAVARFRADSYERFIGTDAHAALCSEELQSLRDKLTATVTGHIAPSAEHDADRQQLNRIVERLNSLV
jgi:hypothetical protein